MLLVTAKAKDQKRNIARQISEKAKEILEKMGADIIDVPPVSETAELNESSVNTHGAGGVIMGDNPETSAVNNYSQVWEMENIYLNGVISLTHLNNSNPTETIVDFAYRDAEDMINYLENGGGLLVEGKRRKRTV